VLLDKAAIAKVPDRTATIVVGNPLIADVSIQADGTMAVTGKG
jgi:Flp pilus assembly secretin CpaC